MGRFLLLVLTVGLVWPSIGHAQFWRRKQAALGAKSEAYARQERRYLDSLDAAQRWASDSIIARQQGLPWPPAIDTGYAPKPKPVYRPTPLAKPTFPERKYVLGLGFSTIQYAGDLTTRDGFQGLYPGVNVSISPGGRKLVYAQLNLGYGNFAADDPLINTNGTSAPNTYVKTSYIYADVVLRARFRGAHSLRPHAGLGLGYLSFSSQDVKGSDLERQAATRDLGETYSSGALEIPLTIGLVWDLSDRLALGLDYYRTYTLTDYLDNIGTLGPADGNDRLDRLQFSLLIGLQ